MRAKDLKALLAEIQTDQRPKLPPGNHLVRVEGISAARTKDGRDAFRVVVVDDQGRSAVKIMSADKSIVYLLRALKVKDDDEEIIGKTVTAAVKAEGYVHAFLSARKQRDYPTSDELERMQAQYADDGPDYLDELLKG